MWSAASCRMTAECYYDKRRCNVDRLFRWYTFTQSPYQLVIIYVSLPCLRRLQDVAHIWELGGGSHVSDLVRVPITPDRFRNALYVIVLDLSKPSSAIPHLLHWTDQIKVNKRPAFFCCRGTVLPFSALSSLGPCRLQYHSQCCKMVLHPPPSHQTHTLPPWKIMIKNIGRAAHRLATTGVDCKHLKPHRSFLLGMKKVTDLTIG